MPDQNQQTFSEEGAWCWFQDPRALYHYGKHERTYAQWITHSGDLQLGAYDHDSGQIQYYTLKKGWGQDDHNVGAFLIRPDHRLMVFYARHDKKGIFARISTEPEDITHWEAEITISNTRKITYAHPVYLSQEKMYYLFWRGPNWKPSFASSPDGKNWSKAKILLQEPGRKAANIRPYLKLESDGKSLIHFAFTDGHPRNEPQNSIYYLLYRQGQFFNADGAKVGDMNSLPIDPSLSDKVYDGQKTNVRAWLWDIAQDSQGNPVIAYTRLPSEKDHRYAYARWTGSKWNDQELTPAGPWFPQTQAGEKESEPHYSGGIALNHNDPSELFLAREIKGVFEIEKWSSSDKGKSWGTAPMTQNSTQNNIRPMVPRNTPYRDHLLWMQGPYQSYTDFQTSIQFSLPHKEEQE